MIVADASVVIAAMNPGDAHHDEAQRIILEHGPAGIALHSLTLSEILVGPARSGAEGTVRQKLAAAGIALAPAGDPTPEDLARVRAATSLAMPDACVLAQAEHLGVPLATFDKRLARETVARGVVVLGTSDQAANP